MLTFRDRKCQISNCYLSPKLLFKISKVSVKFKRFSMYCYEMGNLKFHYQLIFQFFVHFSYTCNNRSLIRRCFQSLIQTCNCVEMQNTLFYMIQKIVVFFFFTTFAPDTNLSTCDFIKVDDDEDIAFVE